MCPPAPGIAPCAAGQGAKPVPGLTGDLDVTESARAGEARAQGWGAGGSVLHLSFSLSR
jgi:hypothetical protein